MIAASPVQPQQQRLRAAAAAATASGPPPPPQSSNTMQPVGFPRSAPPLSYLRDSGVGAEQHPRTHFRTDAPPPPSEERDDAFVIREVHGVVRSVVHRDHALRKVSQPPPAWTTWSSTSHSERHPTRRAPESSWRRAAARQEHGTHHIPPQAWTLQQHHQRRETALHRQPEYYVPLPPPPRWRLHPPPPPPPLPLRDLRNGSHYGGRYRPVPSESSSWSERSMNRPASTPPSMPPRRHEPFVASPPDLGLSRIRQVAKRSLLPCASDPGSKRSKGFDKLDLLCSATLEIGPLHDNPLGCSCPKSKCVALYCDCFKAGRRCDPSTCSCADCKNTVAESGPDGARTKAIRCILARNPRAFTTAGLGNPLHKLPPGEVACNCIRSRCLKLYCSCFQAGKPCNPKVCTCVGCLNTTADTGGHRRQAIQQCLEKRPDAFKTRVREPGLGCACKNNRCIRKYCECFRTNRTCTDKCSCRQCANTGEQQGAPSLMEQDQDKGI